MQFRGRLLYLRVCTDRNMTGGQRGLRPNVRHHWLMSHLNQAAIFHHCSFSRPSVPLCAQDLVIVMRCDGAGIPRVSPWLQFNLVSTPLLCPIALPFIVHPSTAVLCWKKFHILLKPCSDWTQSTHPEASWTDENNLKNVYLCSHTNTLVLTQVSAYFTSYLTDTAATGGLWRINMDDKHSTVISFAWLRQDYNSF